MEILTPRHRAIHEEWRYEFRREGDREYRWSFPCDEQGSLIVDEDYDIRGSNMEKLLQSPEWHGDIRKISWSYTENATGTCECGKEIELYDEYQGACECPYCGAWHNLFGEKLLQPRYWEEY